jgi:hypothetical protein
VAVAVERPLTPTMRAGLAMEATWQLPALLWAVAAAALAVALLAGPRQQAGWLVGIGVGVAALAGLATGPAYRAWADLRAGTYVEATGPVELVRERDGEGDAVDTLVVGERTFKLDYRVDGAALWSGLTGAPAPDRGTERRSATATVLYLAHAGRLLEVRDAGGALVARHRAYARVAPAAEAGPPD